MDINTKVIMVNDVSRAFFEAPAMRQVCVELPKEDRTSIDQQLDNVGHLQVSLYGTSDAAMTASRGADPLNDEPHKANRHSTGAAHAYRSGARGL